jgi:predicted transcriptional regulator
VADDGIGVSVVTERASDTERESETERVLEISVQDLQSFASDSKAALEEALETGEEGPAVLAFETPKQALRVFSDARYELLEAIRAHDPESIRELARIVDRDVSTVHNDLDLLTEHGIVEFQQQGRNKRPYVAYDEIHIDIDLSFDSDSGAKAAAQS